jgi:tetratricopeptide (TPR) repeat protein
MLDVEKVAAICKKYLNDPSIPIEVRRGEKAFVYLYGKGHEFFESYLKNGHRELLENARECLDAAVISFNNDGNSALPQFYDMILLDLGAVCAQQGEDELAFNIFSHCLRLSKEDQYKGGIAGTLFNLGLLYEKQDDYSNARSCYSESLKLQSSTGYFKGKKNLALTQLYLGKVEFHFRNFNESLELVKKAREVFKDLGLWKLREEAEELLLKIRKAISHRSA